MALALNCKSQPGKRDGVIVPKKEAARPSCQENQEYCRLMATFARGLLPRKRIRIASSAMLGQVFWQV
jgi:hypothetical protein